MQEAPNASPSTLFSPPSFLLREKRWGRRRRVRNDHDGTNPCKQGFLSSVLVSSFPNRKLNLRVGFFLCKSVTTSQSRLRRASIPTPFIPSGHFPLIGGIGPWEGSQGMRTAGSTQNRRQPLSQPAADSIPTPFVPSGHFPLIGGIGPWEGSLTYEKERLPWEAAPCF